MHRRFQAGDRFSNRLINKWDVPTKSARFRGDSVAPERLTVCRASHWSSVGCGFAAALRCRLRRRVLVGDGVARWVHARNGRRLGLHPPHREPVLDGVNAPLHYASLRSAGLVDTVCERVPKVVVGDGQGCLWRGLPYRVIRSLQRPPASLAVLLQEDASGS